MNSRIERVTPPPPWATDAERGGESGDRPASTVGASREIEVGVADRTLRIARPVELARGTATRTGADGDAGRAPWESASATGSPRGNDRQWPNPNHQLRAPLTAGVDASIESVVYASPESVREVPRSWELTREALFPPVRRPPGSGWRRWVWVLTVGLVNVGVSPADVRRRELVARVCQPIRGNRKVAFVGLKGGVGKTTSTLGAGSTFAALRGDHVVAVDANPDKGTLADRVPSETAATVRDLLDDAARIGRYADVRAYTSQAPSRLEVLASERDPHKAEAFSEADYRNTVRVLENFYNLILTDCGTGLTHGAMRGVLDTADALVLVSSPALDGAQSADATLNWLDAQGYGHLVERTVVVISSARPGADTVDLGQLVEHFDAKVRAVQVIPYDQHLAEGSEVDLNRLSPAARHAFVTLAALVAEDFPQAAGRHHGPSRPRS